jgi:hypothetical protein
MAIPVSVSHGATRQLAAALCLRHPLLRLNRDLIWDPDIREIVGDSEANSFLSRENRKGYEINM